MKTMGTRAAGAAGIVLCVAMAMVLALLPVTAAVAQSGGSPGGERLAAPDPTVCSDIVIPPASDWPPGGHWWNPKRYGVGWQTVYQQVNGVRMLSVYWYTYDAQRHPVWYVSEPAAFVDGHWSAALRVRLSNGNYTGAGQLTMRTIQGHPERVGVRWQRSHGGIHASQQECLLDLLRTVPIDAEGELDPRADSTYGGVWTPRGDGDLRTLNFAMNSASGPEQVELLIPLMHDQAGEPVWLWAQHPDGSGLGSLNGTFTHKIHYPTLNYPVTGECEAQSDACVEHSTLDSHDTVQRQFQNPFLGQAQIRIGPNDGGAFTVQGRNLRGWWRPFSGNGTVTIDKLDPHNVIEVDTYECEVAPGQTTCPVRVVWAVWPTPSTVSIWRRHQSTCPPDANQGDTDCLELITTTQQSDQTTQDLTAWQRLRYELRAGTEASGQLLAHTPFVRSFGVMADATVESLGAPNHDPTVGATPGEGGVSGGAATYEIPIQVPPGRAGLEPNLALVYSSRSGNGIAGLGWSLSGLSSIHRCPQTIDQDQRNTAVTYGPEDRLCLDGRRLVRVSGAAYGLVNAVYRTEIDDFAKVTQLGGPIAPGTAAYFKVEHKNGRIDWYGACVHGGCAGHEARHRPAGASGPLSWALVSREDRAGSGEGQGNSIRYRYQDAGHGEFLISSIRYTGFQGAEGNRRVDFEYVSRDTASTYLGEGLSFKSRYLQYIRTYAPGSSTPVRQYELNYGSPSQATGRTLLRSVRECGYQGASVRCKDQTVFGWQDAPPVFDLKPMPGLPMPAAVSLPQVEPGQDPYAALLRELQLERVPPSQRDAFEAGELDAFLPQSVEAALFEFRPLADLTGDGAVEWYTRVRTGQNQYASYLVRFTPDRQLAGVHALGDVDLSFRRGLGGPVDINNDGKAELLARRNGVVAFGFWTGSGISYHHTPIPSPVSLNYSGADTLHVQDFDGDGKPDVLTTYPAQGMVTQPAHGCASTDRVVVLYRNLSPDSHTTTPQFTTTPQPVTCLARHSFPNGHAWESIERVTDFDGNGLPDLILQQPRAASGRHRTQRVLLARQPSAGTLTFETRLAGQLGPDMRDTDLERGAATTVSYWADINGDGLEDLVVGGTLDAGISRFWKVRFNVGGTLGPRLTATGAHAGAGLQADQTPGLPDSGRLRYPSLLRLNDVDGDGRPDLLVPGGFALRVCIPITHDPGNPRDLPGTNTYCPERPGADPDLPSIGIGQVLGLHEYGNGHRDLSIYTMSALRFVQTGPTSLSLQPIAASGLLSRPVTSGERQWNGDVYGDGLPDLLIQIGVDHALVSQFIAPNDFGGCLPTRLWLEAGACDFETSQFANPANRKVFLAENRGAGHRGPGLPPHAPELMKYAEDGLARRHSWSYFPLSSSAGRSSGEPRFYSIPARESGTGYIDAKHFYFTSTMNAVESYGVSDGVGDVRFAAYSYTEAMYNNRGRGFQGFRSILEDRHGWTSEPTRTTTLFHQMFPFTGLVQRSQLRLLSDSPALIPIEHHDYYYSAVPPTLQPGQPVHPYLMRHDTQLFDVGSPTSPRRVHTTKTRLVESIDAYGNILRERVVIDDGATSMCTECTHPEYARRIELTENQFAPDAGTWWVNRLISSKKTRQIRWFRLPFPSEDPNQDDLTQVLTTTLFYDAQHSHRKPFRIHQSGSGEHNWRRTDYGFDAWANINSERLYGAHIAEANAREIQRSYAASDGYFVTSTSNALGHTATASYDPRFGLAVSQTDVNGLTTTTTLDAFGRPITTTPPSAGGLKLAPPIHTGLQRCSAAYPCTGIARAVYRQETRQDGTPITIVYFDHLGREVGTERRGRHSQNTWVRTLRQYLGTGSVHRESAPHFRNAQVHWTVYGHYDPLGRVRTLTTPTPHGARTTTYTYEGLTTTITATAPQADVPSLSMRRTYTADGRLLNTVDALNGEVDYRYDGAGNLVLLVDPIGAAITAEYDGLGQRTEMTDPNRGNWSFRYLADGQLRRQTDGRGWEQEWHYDRLGRKTEEFEWRRGEPGWSNWRSLYRWSYDSAQYGIGLPASARRSDTLYEQFFYYDALSRPKEEHVAIRERRHPERPPGQDSGNDCRNNPDWCNPWAINYSFAQRWSYDGHYGWLKQTYRGPQATTIGQGAYSQYQRRDRYGYLIEEGGVPDFDPDPNLRRYGRLLLAEDAFGNVTQQHLGNQTELNVPGRQTDTYAAQTGQLLSRCVGVVGGGCTILNLGYGYLCSCQPQSGLGGDRVKGATAA